MIEPFKKTRLLATLLAVGMLALAGDAHAQRRGNRGGNTTTQGGGGRVTTTTPHNNGAARVVTPGGNTAAGAGANKAAVNHPHNHTGQGNAHNGTTHTGNGAVVNGGHKPGHNGVVDHSHRHGDWNQNNRNGWNHNNWNNQWNSYHQRSRHGYWLGGIWYPPYFVTQRQPIAYLQAAQPIVAGRKWLGVTYEPYQGGGAYVTGIYQGSPAQQAGIQPGDVIAYIDGQPVTDLPTTVQNSDGDVDLEILSGRTGEYLQSHVNLVSN